MDGPTPYREGKPLTDIIPPDTRRQKTIIIIAASMVAGVCLWMLGGWALEMLAAQSDEARPIVVPVTPGYIAGRIAPGMLHGPGGYVSMPPKGRSVLHVWVQGCSDCMPAFEAMHDLETNGGLGVRVPIINVAYGEADQGWARRYGVANNLVFDPGGTSLVKPLGIGTFTTLVVEPDGAIIHRDRPDRPGYAARVQSAMQYGSGVTTPTHQADPLSEAPPTGATVLDSQAVQRVVAAHRAGIKRTCWELRPSGDNMVTQVNVTVTLTVGTDGTVTQSAAQGDNPVIAKCIESQARSWSFPRPPSPTTVNIPFKFVQE